MKKVAILQSNYIPWKGYFDLIHDVDVFVYYDEVQYTKNDWRNRNRIYSKNGLQWITIPISKHAVKQTISQVMMENNEWQKLHFKSIYYTYKQAPFFHQLEPLLYEVYVDTQWRLLVDINRHLIERIARLIGIKTIFLNSKDFEFRGDRADRLIYLLQQVHATQYLSGPSAKHYLDGYEHKFTENGIVLTYKEYSGYPIYNQLSAPFEQAVSILDMIANIELSRISDYIWGWRSSEHAAGSDIPDSVNPAPYRTTG